MKIQPQNYRTYIRQNISKIRDVDFPLEKLDLRKAEGIQSGIPLFEGVNLENIKFITKWFQVLNLTRGCSEQCTFCLRNALSPLKNSAEQINTILWEDLNRFTQGFAKLSERLDTNVLGGNSHISLFEDSNLPVAKIMDLNGETHSAQDAIQNINENLHIPQTFVTSGWNLNDKTSQDVAEKICRYVLENPQCSREFAVSINPFHQYNNNFYTNKMANVLKTFLPLFKNDCNLGSILLKYNRPNGIDSEKNGYESAKKLYSEIYAKLQKLTDSKLEDYESLKPENVTLHFENNYIENKGRGQKFFVEEEREQNRKHLFVESFEWMTLTPEQKKARAYDCMTKNVDINGRVYLITPSEQAIETNIKLNYINKDKQTAQVHSDMKFIPLK